MTGLVWTRQPQTGLRVNRANPLARGLVRLIIFNQGQPYDLLTNERLTVVGTAFGPAFTPDGVGIQNTAETAYWTLPLRTDVSPSSFSMGWVGQHAGGTTPITVRDATSSGGSFMFRRITSQWNMRLGGTDFTAGGTFSTGTPYRALISGSAASSKLWVNGALVINGGAPGPSGFITPWYIHQNGTAGSGPTATSHLLAIWDRPVTDIEGQSFTVNPWQLVAPRRRPVFGFTVTAGGHATSGALAADAATVAGSATHLTLHATTGALAAGAAVVAGAALHPHTTTGALSAGAAVVAGSADHTTPGGTHATTGALSASAATVAGSATHLALHAAAGAMAAGSAVVAGTAAHLTLHTTTGALTAGAATVAGVAVHSGAGAVQPRAQGAGRSSKRQRRVIEINGQDVVVESIEEAQALLDSLKEEAQKKAAIAVQRAVDAPNRKPRKVLADARRLLQVPAIEAPGLESEAAQALRDIEAIYKSAMVTVEVAALLAKRQREEEDDEDVLLLIA